VYAEGLGQLSDGGTGLVALGEGVHLLGRQLTLGGSSGASPGWVSRGRAGDGGEELIDSLVEF
jgi:hypothetical protein